VKFDKIKLVTGTLTEYPEADAVVNAANDMLEGGSGVCGALFKVAGWDAMQASCNEHPVNEEGVRCPTGYAVVTPAHGLPNKAVIHAVGPIYDPNPVRAREKRGELASAYQSSLDALDRHGLKTIAFPALSCGVYRYPLDEAATVALKALAVELEIHPDIEWVHFVFLPFGDGPEVKVAFEKALEGLISKGRE